MLQIKGPLLALCERPPGCTESRIGAPVRSSELRGSAGSGPLSWAPRVRGPGKDARSSRRQQRSVLAGRPGARSEESGPLGAAGRGPRAGAGVAWESQGSRLRARPWQAGLKENKTKQLLRPPFLCLGAPGLSRGLPGFQLPIQLSAGDLRARRARTAGGQLGRETVGFWGNANGHLPPDPNRNTRGSTPGLVCVPGFRSSWKGAWRLEPALGVPRKTLFVKLCSPAVALGLQPLPRAA